MISRVPQLLCCSITQKSTAASEQNPCLHGDTPHKVAPTTKTPLPNDPASLTLTQYRSCAGETQTSTPSLLQKHYSSKFNQKCCPYQLAASPQHVVKHAKGTTGLCSAVAGCHLMRRPPAQSTHKRPPRATTQDNTYTESRALKKNQEERTCCNCSSCRIWCPYWQKHHNHHTMLAASMPGMLHAMPISCILSGCSKTSHLHVCSMAEQRLSKAYRRKGLQDTMTPSPQACTLKIMPMPYVIAMAIQPPNSTRRDPFHRAAPPSQAPRPPNSTRLTVVAAMTM